MTDIKVIEAILKKDWDDFTKIYFIKGYLLHWFTLQWLIDEEKL